MNLPFISREQSWQSQYGNYYGSAQKMPLKKILLIGGAIVVVAIIVTVAVIVAKNQRLPEDIADDDIIAGIVDPGEVDESLNEHLREAVKDEPYKNFTTTTANTKYADLDEDFLPTNVEDGIDEEVLVYSAAFSVLGGKYVSPLSLDKDNLEDKADSLGISIRKINAANSNVLNFYLDNGSIMIIKAKGNSPFSDSDKFVLVYAGNLELGTYEYYTPGEKCTGCTVPFTITKLDLFSAMKSNEIFYVLSKEVE